MSKRLFLKFSSDAPNRHWNRKESLTLWVLSLLSINIFEISLSICDFFWTLDKSEECNNFSVSILASESRFMYTNFSLYTISSTETRCFELSC